MAQVAELLASEPVREQENKRPDHQGRKSDRPEESQHEILHAEDGREKFVHLGLGRDELQTTGFCISPLQKRLRFRIAGNDDRRRDRVISDLAVKVKGVGILLGDLVVLHHRGIETHRVIPES